MDPAVTAKTCENCARQSPPRWKCAACERDGRTAFFCSLDCLRAHDAEVHSRWPASNAELDG